MDDSGPGLWSQLFNKPVGIVADGFSSRRYGDRKRNGFDGEKHKEDILCNIEDESQGGQKISSFEREMIQRILKLSEIKAKDIMTPRTSVFAIDVEDELSEVLEEVIEERYSRIPVYEKDIDNVIGILHIKDLFAQSRKGNLELIHLRGILRECFFIHEFKSIDELFMEMQKKRVHFATVIDEYGGFSGILTIEDILEQIVGDIADEDDEEEIQDMIKISGTTYKVDGYKNISEINEELDLDLSTQVNETIGGMLLEALGKLPEDEGDLTSAIIGNVELKAIKVSDKRIESLLLKIK